MALLGFMDNLTNAVKMHSQRQDQTYSHLRRVKIKEYDPKTNRVLTTLFDPNTADWTYYLNWMPWFVPFNGQGEDTDAGTGELWGMVYGPCINEFAFMMPLAGDMDNGIIIGGHFTNPRPPPAIDGRNCQSGEWMYKHKSTSYMYWDNAGNLNLYTNNDFDLVVHGTANITVLHDANVTVGGNTTLNLDGNLSATVGGNTTLNVDGNVTAVIGGNLSVDADGSLIATVGGSASVNAGGDLDAAVGGSATIAALGSMSLDAMDSISLSTNGEFNVTAVAGVNMRSTGPIQISSTTEIITAAPYSPESTLHTEIVPPLIPIVLGPPQAPNQPQRPVVAAIPGLPADGTTFNGAAEPNPPANATATAVTDTSATIAFQDPNVST